MNSRAKGARGEREFAAFLRERGYAARRGQQFSGGGDSPDVVSSVAGVHWEVKRVEAGNPYVWMDQAVRDAVDKVPVVAHRKNDKEWLAVLRMEDFLNIIGERETLLDIAYPKVELKNG